MRLQGHCPTAVLTAPLAGAIFKFRGRAPSMRNANGGGLHFELGGKTPHDHVTAVCFLQSSFSVKPELQGRFPLLCVSC